MARPSTTGTLCLLLVGCGGGSAMTGTGGHGGGGGASAAGGSAGGRDAGGQGGLPAAGGASATGGSAALPACAVTTRPADPIDNTTDGGYKDPRTHVCNAVDPSGPWVVAEPFSWG